MTINRRDLIVAAVLGVLIASFCFFSSADRGYTIVHRICDGCFTTGILLTGIGVIMHCSNKGALNLFGFGAKFGLNLILPIFGKNPWTADGERETYYDYCMRKAEADPKPVSHLLIVGGAFLVTAAILLVVYLIQG